MDEIKQRLKDASEACITTFEAWRAKTGDAAAREALQEAVHELRKVAARLEIELAVSDRKTQGSEPIPIPSHRASRRPAQGADLDLEDDSRHNRNPNMGQRDNNRGGSRPVQIRRPQDSQASGSAPAGAAPAGAEGNAAPAAEAGGEEDAPRRTTKPLSLKRGGNDAE